MHTSDVFLNPTDVKENLRVGSYETSTALHCQNGPYVLLGDGQEERLVCMFSGPPKGIGSKLRKPISAPFGIFGSSDKFMVKFGPFLALFLIPRILG